ncbi:MAG: hypothetical protein II715_02635 [Clostridia bacterium]|nr:hypothetical protein [Clostridia bacterium]
MQDIRNESTERLFRAIAGLKTADECFALFEDLCTIKEIQDMAQRFDTAVMLDQGKKYSEIAGKVGASTATISRVNRCLEYGSGGYRAAIEKLKKSGK